MGGGGGRRGGRRGRRGESGRRVGRREWEEGRRRVWEEGGRRGTSPPTLSSHCPRNSSVLMVCLCSIRICEDDME